MAGRAPLDCPAEVCALRVDGRLYGWKEDRGASEQLFQLYDVGDEFYIAAGRQSNPRVGDPYLYGSFVA